MLYFKKNILFYEFITLIVFPTFYQKNSNKVILLIFVVFFKIIIDYFLFFLHLKIKNILNFHRFHLGKKSLQIK